MKRSKFSFSILLVLLGVAIIGIAGIWKPVQFLPYHQWKNRIAPVHLAWMAGLILCVAGLLLLLRDALFRMPDDRETLGLREEILTKLQQTGFSPQRLNELIAARYGKTGVLSLSTAELREVLTLIETQTGQPLT